MSNIVRYDPPIMPLQSLEPYPLEMFGEPKRVTQAAAASFSVIVQSAKKRQADGASAEASPANPKKSKVNPAIDLALIASPMSSIAQANFMADLRKKISMKEKEVNPAAAAAEPAQNPLIRADIASSQSAIHYDWRVENWYTNPNQCLEKDPLSIGMSPQQKTTMIWQHTFSKEVDLWVHNEKYSVFGNGNKRNYYNLPAIVTRPGKKPQAMEFQYTFGALDELCFHRYCRTPTKSGTQSIWEKIGSSPSIANELAGEKVSSPMIRELNGTTIQLLDISKLG